MNESVFLIQNPNAERLSEYDGKTAKAYHTEKYLWLFGKSDGHLVWKFNIETVAVEYECEPIEGGRLNMVTKLVSQMEIPSEWN